MKNIGGANLPAFRMSHVRAARPLGETWKPEGAPVWARPSQFRFAKDEIWRISHETILLRRKIQINSLLPAFHLLIENGASVLHGRMFEKHYYGYK